MLSPRHQLVICLGINCTIGYGTLLYSFSLLSLEIEKTFEWSTAFIYGVYSLGILLGGIAAPFLGKALDRYGAQYPMAAGSLIMACCLYGLSITSSKIEFVVYLLLLEVLSILVLYESAFVAIVKAIPTKKYNTQDHNQTKNTDGSLATKIKESTRLSITQITLMAGFASTIFWPLIAYLLSITHWRDVYVMMALLHLIVCFPLHLYCLRTSSSSYLDNAEEGRYKKDNHKVEEKTLAKNPFAKKLKISGQQWKTELLLALSFGGVAFCVNGLQIHIFSIMEMLTVEHGLAVLAGSLIGPFQVVSRLMDVFLSRRVTPIFLGALSIICMLCGLLFLLSASVISGYTVLLFAIFFGMGQGLTNIVRGAIPFYLFGDQHYGAITGRINGVRIIMTAIAPLSLSMLMHHTSVEAVLMLLSICLSISLWILICLRNQHRVTECNIKPVRTKE
ncbi:putative transport protein [gamma proteobacterium IMCC1989]|nr:putative transport protein [gamma proteobacterium IMCC1989]